MIKKPIWQPAAAHAYKVLATSLTIALLALPLALLATLPISPQASADIPPPCSRSALDSTNCNSANCTTFGGQWIPPDRWDKTGLGTCLPDPQACNSQYLSNCKDSKQCTDAGGVIFEKSGNCVAKLSDSTTPGGTGGGTGTGTGTGDAGGTGGSGTPQGDGSTAGCITGDGSTACNALADGDCYVNVYGKIVSFKSGGDPGGTGVGSPNCDNCLAKGDQAQDTTKINCSGYHPPSTSGSGNCDASGCDLMAKYVQPIFNLLSASIGLLCVISIIVGGVQYTSSGGDPQKVTKAKARIFKTVLALVAYAFLYGFLQFIIPGGLFT